MLYCMCLINVIHVHTFIQYIQHTEGMANQLTSYQCFHCARLESMYWISVYTLGALLQFQYHSCEEIVYFSRDFCTTFIQYIQRNEVTSGQQVLSRCFHCARLESMYWISVYTFGALLQFQYHCCEEIVYFSRDFSTTFIQCIHQNEVTSGQQVLYRCFHCARLQSKYWNSVYIYGAHLQFQYHSCEEIVYFWRDFSTTFIQCIQHNEVTSGQQVYSRCFHCASLESKYWNTVSTFQGIIEQLSFNTSSITKSHRANRCYTDAFIVLDLNRSTEIQYPLFRHFFNFRTTAVKR